MTQTDLGAWLLGVVMVVPAASASPVFVPGTGDPRSECYVGLQVDGPRQVEVRGSRVIQHSCGDRCTFDVQLCVNQPSPGCAPAQSSDIVVRGPVALNRPIASTALDCGELRRLEVRIAKGARKRRKRLTLVAHAPEARPRRDRDSLTFVCIRSAGACCGDGNTDPGEQCDDDNGQDGDGCDSNCTVTSCGNGIHAGTEECDDGNLMDGDGCDGNCNKQECGNGRITEGEQCDPGSAESASCSQGPADGACSERFCNERCQCECRLPCECGPIDRGMLLVTTREQAGSCGQLVGGDARRLDCGTLSIGGGHASIPALRIPAGVTTAVHAICSGKRLSLIGEPCADGECRFGPPLHLLRDPVASSLCLVNRIQRGRAVTGSVDCESWETRVNLPLRTEVTLGTSEECPPADPDPNPLRLELALDLSSSRAELAATSRHGPNSELVFFGFCAKTGGFAFEQRNGAAVACDDAPCDEAYPRCRQRTPGAFGTDAVGIVETGASPGNLADGAMHSATLVGVFGVPPMFRLDTEPDLPGPGAISLPVWMRLVPEP